MLSPSQCCEVQWKFISRESTNVPLKLPSKHRLNTSSPWQEGRSYQQRWEVWVAQTGSSGENRTLSWTRQRLLKTKQNWGIWKFKVHPQLCSLEFCDSFLLLQQMHSPGLRFCRWLYLCIFGCAGSCCCTWAFSSSGEWGLPFVTALRLTLVASLSEYRL